MTIDAAVVMALEQNLELKAERIANATARARIARHLAEYIPHGIVSPLFSKWEAVSDPNTADHNQTALQFSVRQKLPFGGEIDLSYIHTRQSAVEDDAAFEIGLSQHVLKAGLAGPLAVDIALARYDLAINQTLLAEFETKLIRDVKIACFETLIAQQHVANQIEALKLAQALRDVTHLRSRLGLHPEIETLAVEIEVQKSKQALIQSRNELLVANSKLQRLLSLNQEIFVADRMVVEPVVWDDMAAIKKGLIDNPALSRMRRVIEKQCFIVTAADNQRLPEMKFFGRYKKHLNAAATVSADASSREELTAGLHLAIPIYNLGPQQRLLEEKLKLKQLKLQFKDYKAKLALDIQMRIDTCKGYYRWVEEAQRQIFAIGNLLRLARRAYDSGLISIDRVIDNRNDQLVAKNRYLSACLAHLKTVAEVEFLLGQPHTDKRGAP